MAEATYFVKIRGRVIGPFPPDRLIQMVRQGNLSRIHQISPDGKSWQTASEYPQFFQLTTAAASVATNQPTAKQSSAGLPTGGNEFTLPTQNLEINDAEQWYYGINDQSTGPVSRGMIMQLLSTGQLSQTDMLWQSGMTDWKPVKIFHQFAGVANHGQPANRPSDRFSADTRTQDVAVEKGGLLAISQLFRASNPWVYFCFIFLYVIAVPSCFSGMFGLIQGTQRANFFMIVLSIMGLVQTGLLIVATVFLNKHATAASRFVVSKSLSDLHDSMNSLGRFWMWIGILLTLSIAVAITAIFCIYTLAGAGALGSATF